MYYIQPYVVVNKRRGGVAFRAGRINDFGLGDQEIPPACGPFDSVEEAEGYLIRWGYKKSKEHADMWLNRGIAARREWAMRIRELTRYFNH